MLDLNQRIADGLHDLAGRAPVNADVWPAAQRYVTKHRRQRHALAGAIVVTALLAGGVMTAAVVRGADSKAVVSHPSNTTVTTVPITTLRPTGPISGTLTIKASPTGGLSYSPESLTVATGIYGVTLRDEANAQHTLAFEDPATLWPVLTVNSQGEATSARIFFGRPGMYTFYCIVSGHRAAGMQGVVHVTGPAMTLDAAEAAARSTGGSLNASSPPHT